MRRRWLVAAAVLLLLAAWLRRPAAPPSVRPSPSPPAARPAATPPPPRVAVAPPLAPTSPEVAALEHLAAATGRYVAACPAYVGSGDWAFGHPGRRSVPNPGGGFVAMVDDPSGMVEIREHHERVLREGWVEQVGPSEVLAVLHWRTDADGRTTCVLQPPEPRDVQVRVLDTEGQPVDDAELLVLTHPTVPEGHTGSDGWGTIRLYADERAWVVAYAEGDESEPAWLDPAAGPATMVLERTGRTPDQAFARMKRVGEAQMVQDRADLAGALADPDLPPEVAAVLAAWDAELAARLPPDLR